MRGPELETRSRVELARPLRKPDSLEASESQVGAPNGGRHKIKDEDFPMPRVLLLFNIWFWFSTMTHLIGIFHATAVILVYEGFFGLDIHMNCYILGRLSLHEAAVKIAPWLQLLTNVLHSILLYIVIIFESQYRLDALLFLLTDEKKLELQLNGDLGKGCEKLGIKSPKNNYLKEILYIEMRSGAGDGFRHYLRPNRTLLAHRQLTESFERILLWSMRLFYLLIIITEPIIFNTGFFDINYIKSYPTCSPELESLAAEGKLSRWSITIYPPNHRLLVGPFDIIINLYVYLDDLMALIFPTSIALLLSRDLALYWTHIKQDLLDYLSNVRRSLAEDSNPNDSLNHIDNESPTFAQFTNLNLSIKNNKYRLRAFILQRQITDFFSQQRRCDKFISPSVSFLFIIWITVFVTTSFMTLQINDSFVINIIRVFQVYGCAALSAPVLGLLTLRRFIRETYPIIGAIMAHERDPVSKTGWSQVLEHYTARENYGFTLFHSLPLTSMSLLNCFATSVSYLIIFQTFRVYLQQ